MDIDSVVSLYIKMFCLMIFSNFIKLSKVMTHTLQGIRLHLVRCELKPCREWHKLFRGNMTINLLKLISSKEIYPITYE